MSDRSQERPAASGRWFEHGRIGRVPALWWRLGPVFAEFHGWRWKLGVCAGPWYVGVLLGPLVVTVGRRQFAAPPEPTHFRVTWEAKEVARGTAE